jgi:hypothetical protein
MKNLFSTHDTTELLQRLNELKPQSQPGWGKMDVAQMLAHCAAAMEVAAGKKTLPRMWLGRIFGKVAKPSYLNEKPFAKNSPTNKHIRVTEPKDFADEKEKLTKLIVGFASAGPSGVNQNPHFFLGRLSPEEWSRTMYKHLDHHLTQFGV